MNFGGAKIVDLAGFVREPAVVIAKIWKDLEGFGPRFTHSMSGTIAPHVLKGPR